MSKTVLDLQVEDSLSKTLDVIIIGAGPAGLTASIYCSCFHLSHVIIGKTVGGQLQLAPDILNYPGFENITGKELTNKMVKQVASRAKEVGTDVVNGELIEDEVIRIEQIKDSKFKIQTYKGEAFICKSVILATGMERRKLNVPGEIEYTGKGVAYCATCERQDYKDQICAVVGGANSAVQAAVQVAQVASKVYLIYRGSKLRGDPVWLDQINQNKKITIICNALVEKITGTEKELTGINIFIKGNSDQNNRQEIKLNKLFIEIGGVPGSALMIPIGVKMDKGGYVHVSQTLETNVPGVFAAGDLIHYGFSIEQIASAVGLGARAAASAFTYLKGDKSAPSVWGKSRIKR